MCESRLNTHLISGRDRRILTYKRRIQVRRRRVVGEVVILVKRREVRILGELAPRIVDRHPVGHRMGYAHPGVNIEPPGLLVAPERFESQEPDRRICHLFERREIVLEARSTRLEAVDPGTDIHDKAGVLDAILGVE